MRTIPVRTQSATYDVLVGNGLLSTLRPRIEKVLGLGPRRFFIITSPGIWALWSERVLSSFGIKAPVVLFVPAGEASKKMSIVEALATQLSEAGADRNSVLLALGGGVIGDLSGFVAAIYMRGIDYVQIPTTFLSQVDSSVGGKTGVNLKSGKNLIGAFHHPRTVFADSDVLATLPDEELRAGLFESIKAGFIRDRRLLGVMEREHEAILARDSAVLEKVIAASIRMKAEVVGEDERESGLRMILNFGHTLGHALENVLGYGVLLHGEAVGYGMVAALEISRMRDLPQPDYERCIATIRSYGLSPLPRVSLAKLLDKTAGDKKNSGGKRRFVLLSEAGCAYVATDVTDNEVEAGIAAMLKASSSELKPSRVTPGKVKQ